MTCRFSWEEIPAGEVLPGHSGDSDRQSKQVICTRCLARCELVDVLAAG